MSAKTWLLSAVAITSGYGAHTAAATTNYSQEIRSETAAAMQADANQAEQTFYGFSQMMAEQNKKQPESKETTAAALKQQSAAAWDTIAELAPKADVTFFKTKEDYFSTEKGHYNPTANAIVIQMSDYKTAGHYDENSINLEYLVNIAHEKQHDIFYHRTVKTTNGKEVLAREAPMGLEQAYKLEQASETGARIASCIALDQLYVETMQKETATKQAAVSLLSSDKKSKNQYKSLINAINNDIPITISGNTASFEIKKGKSVKVDISENKLTDLLSKTNQLRTTKAAILQEGMNDAVYKEYFEKIANKEINPICKTPEEMSRKMNTIGEICASNWQKYCGDLRGTYGHQCMTAADNYFSNHNFQEIKPNEENFNRACSAALTIGGWDFSDNVCSKLTCTNERYPQADQMILNGANELDVITECSLAKGPNQGYITENINSWVAQNFVSKTKVGTKTLKNQPVVWTAQDAKNYQNILTNLNNAKKGYLPAQQEEINNLIGSLNLQKQKIGSPLSDKQINNLDKLTLACSDANSDFLSRQETGHDTYTNNLSNLNNHIQEASIAPSIKTKLKYIADKILEKNSAALVGYFNFATTKRLIVEAYSGKESGKSAEEFTIKTTIPEKHEGVSASTVTMLDLTQPFLAEQYKKMQIAGAKDRINDKKTADNLVKESKHSSTNSLSKQLTANHTNNER